MSNKHQELLQLAQDKISDANPTYLLDNGANPNIRDPFYHKWTPLHYAVFLNKENFALALLQHPKTNAQLLDSDGFSPLYWASKKSTAKIITALLSKGCDPNERDMHGMTPLFAAVASNNSENVKALLSSPDIDVNQPNQYGGSALHHTAYATDNTDIAELLVKAGADLFLYDYENRAPLHVAKRRKRKRLFKYFKRKMKEIEPDYQCDVSGADSPSETSTTSDPNNLEQPPLDNVDNDDCKGNEDEELKQEDVGSNRPEFGPTHSSLSRTRNNQSLSPPASITQTAALSASPLNDPTNIMNNFMNQNMVSLNLNDVSNRSCDSNFSRQSSDSSNDNHQDTQHQLTDNKTPSSQRNNNPVKIQSNRQMTPNTNPNSNSMRRPRLDRSHHSAQSYLQQRTHSQQQGRQRRDLWHHEHQQRLKQVQENKLKIALKTERSNLNNEARDLLQEQQHYFQFEQEVFYASMKHEYDKIHYQLNHYLEVTKQLIRQNQHLKHENNKLKQAFNGHGGGNRMNIVLTKKSGGSKYKKEFKKWFKKEIGDDFMEYYELFVNSGFDDLRTIRHINDEEQLIELGILKKGHRLHILDKIENYRLQYHQQNQADVALPAFINHSSSSINNKPAVIINDDDVDCVEGSFKTE